MDIVNLLKWHKRFCKGDVCELAMNESLLKRYEEEAKIFFDAANSLATVKEPEAILRLVSVFNQSYSIMVKNLFQNCVDRPIEYTDVRFVQYLATQVTKLRDLREQLDKIISITPELVAPVKTKKGK